MPATAEPMTEHAADLEHPDRFTDRHIGPSPDEIKSMLDFVGFRSLDDFMDAVVPPSIRTSGGLGIGRGLSEGEALDAIRELSSKNEVWRSLIGQGYYGTVTPAVIRRNVLEDPGWYTAYTPYQPEISQGRLEALLNFQTMVADLTGLPVANASMLDEATAAAEAMFMSYSIKGSADRKVFLVAEDCHPAVIAVVKTRALPLGIEVVVSPHGSFDLGKKPFGVLVQYPSTRGEIFDFSPLADRVHESGGLLIAAADLLSLTLLRPPGEFGGDVAVGSTQRFGVPLGFGGPHAAYLATKDEFKRQMPGRVVGISKDARGRPALRLAMQTREQHIRREKATSNICTAQVLLAIMASMYAVYHGPKGLRAIAARVRRMTLLLRDALKKAGYALPEGPVFDTLHIRAEEARIKAVLARAEESRINLRVFETGAVGVSLDERTTEAELRRLFAVFELPAGPFAAPDESLPSPLGRTSPFLAHPVFKRNRSETEMLRYIQRLKERDLSLTTSMIPLGSCTMKLNATTEMIPVTWRKFADLHPFAPMRQSLGYQELFSDLEDLLKKLTGFDAVSLQPNAGAQGEYAGLLVIRKYHETRGEGRRTVCLIPRSAHGTNPASAALAGMKTVIVACDDEGNIDLEDLKAKAREHQGDLAALMVTYPSTHGVFEESIRDICAAVHEAGGQVYLDGANMNAQVGYCRPADYGADVCHLNLHKTFCIPHGGGGPGMGPIAVARHLAPHLPSQAPAKAASAASIGPVSAAPWGSPSILPITWMYIKMMGEEGLKRATAVAVLNANYLAKKLEPHFPVLYKGKNGLVAHECIVDLRPVKAATGILVDDVARRLMDHGFHAPTMSFPVMGTMMIEPTESESKEELDFFIAAMAAIRSEIGRIELGTMDRENNPLKNAPHTAEAVTSGEWTHPYTREEAAYPSPYTRTRKFWPSVGKIDAPYGDRNFICTCGPLD